MALWVHMKSNATFRSMENRVPIITDFELKKGWNFVSYPSLLTRNITDTLSSIDENYIAANIYNVSDINDKWKNYHSDKPEYLNDFKKIKVGQGFYVLVNQECTWTIHLLND